MAETLEADNVPPDAGLELILRNARKVLNRRGYNADQTEARIEELMKRNFPRLAAIMAGPPHIACCE